MRKVTYISVLIINMTGILYTYPLFKQEENKFLLCELRKNRLGENADRFEKDVKIDKTIENYKKALETTSSLKNKKTILLLIAQLYKGIKKNKEAIESYRDYLKLATTSEEIIRGKIALSNIYFETEECDKGLKILDEVIEKYPEYAGEAQYNKASFYHRIAKDYNKAIIEYQKMIEKYPSHWTIRDGVGLLYIADCYVNLKKYEKAIEIYKKLIEKYPNTCSAKIAELYTGVCYIKQKKYEKAIKLYKKITTKYPPDSEMAKSAELYIHFINEYFKKGIEPPPEIIRKELEKRGITGAMTE